MRNSVMMIAAISHDWRPTFLQLLQKKISLQSEVLVYYYIGIYDNGDTLKDNQVQ